MRVGARAAAAQERAQVLAAVMPAMPAAAVVTPAMRVAAVVTLAMPVEAAVTDVIVAVAVAMAATVAGAAVKVVELAYCGPAQRNPSTVLKTSLSRGCGSGRVSGWWNTL